MKIRQFWVVALLVLAACGKPREVNALKTSLVALQSAKAGDDAALAKYQGLLADARNRFKAAKDKLPAQAATDTGKALDRAADAELVWRWTAGIADGLTPWVEQPLLRLGVVESDRSFQQLAASFIAVQQSVDDEMPGEDAAKEKSRNQGRQDLIRQSLESADEALGKAVSGL